MGDEDWHGSEAIGGTARVLAGGLAALVTAAGAFGTTTGGLARLLRNDPVGMWIGLIAAAIAVVFAIVAATYPPAGEFTDTWRRRTLLLAISGGLLLLGLLSVVRAQTGLLQLPYRPQLSASFGSGNTLKVSARADSLRIGDRLSVNVVGLERFSGRLVQYYAGNVGPDGDGVARQEAEARLGQGPPVDEVQVVAAVRHKPSPGDVMDCAGTVTSVTGERSKMEFAPACLVLSSPRR
jgi:hypothetical protein